MSYSGNYVDINFILEKLDTDYEFDDINFADVAEDIWDAIGFVADPDTFETVFAEIVIADYRGTMPSDFYQITTGAVMELDTNIPLTQSGDLMDRFSDDSTILADTDAAAYTYRILNGYIYSGLEDTTLIISYKAFPIANNLPLVPDHAKAIRMVVDYLAEKIAWKLMLKDKLSERKYDRVLQRSYWSTSSWKTASRIPSIDVLEKIKNIHLNHLRNPNMHDNQFKHLGSRAVVYSNPIDEDQELSTTVYFVLTATANAQASYSRPSAVSANNLNTVASLGTWIANISGVDSTLTYSTDVSYGYTTDLIDLSVAIGATILIGDTITFTYTIQ